MIIFDQHNTYNSYKKKSERKIKMVKAKAPEWLATQVPAQTLKSLLKSGAFFLTMAWLCVPLKEILFLGSTPSFQKPAPP